MLQSGTCLCFWTFVKKAREWDLFDGKAPTDSVKKPKLDNRITEFLNEDEMRRLIETLDSWPCKQSADFVRICLLPACGKVKS